MGVTDYMEKSSFVFDSYKTSEAISGAKEGLSDDVFSFVASVTPLINVDLLIEKDGMLLFSWRDDGKNLGWHIPGGIIRYKESFHERIIKTAQNEIGVSVRHDDSPIKISEIFMPYQRRGHSISLLYRCYVDDEYVIDNQDKRSDDSGYLKWFDRCPEQLVEGQMCYKEFLEKYFDERKETG